ncbi:hypothetical protein FA293_31815, partial [Pseudomonas aeruginosa]|nr:hypothetical protein [Pseudomonas aeruginosa]
MKKNSPKWSLTALKMKRLRGFRRRASLRGGAEDSPSGGWISPHQNAEKNYNTFFSFIREKHLIEAQEFRRQGYNSKVPEVDPGLLPQLLDAVDVASRLVHLHTSEKERLGQWLREQIRQLKTFFNRLSGSVIEEWVNDELTNERLVASGVDASLNKSAAQSLVRRVESTLQTLTRVARALGLIVDYSTLDNLRGAVHEVLVNELTEAISPGDRESVTRALRRMMADPANNAAWSKLMDARLTTWEINKPATFGAVIDAVRLDADKANKKARELSGSAQAFFSDIAAFLLRLSIEIKPERSTSAQGAFAESTGTQSDKTATLQESLKESFQKLKTDFRQGKIRLGIVGTTVSKYGRMAARVTQHGDTTAPPPKTPDRGVADSISRSILWQWQQPAVKLQHASGAILSKVAELKKIQGLFSSTDAVNASGNAEDNGVIAASEPHDVDTLLRQWVNEQVEQELPGNQQAAKLAVLSQLLDGDIANARRLVARLGKTQGHIENMLKRQRVAVVNMIYERRSAEIDTALKDMNKALPEIASDLSAAVAALDRALQAAEQPNRDFATAQTHASEAQLLATKAKESISTRSIWHTERPLDEQSRGARLAKHWANLAKEGSSGHWQAPDAREVRAALKNHGLLDATLSTGDPDGYLFATRLAAEFENAQNDELKLPMSPDEYVALEKSLVEFVVSWGQKRVTRGTTRIVVELIFEAVDTVSFSWSSILRVPYKILKASIKIPYRINKVNNYTMPGQDRPYKAIYGMLGKKLKQLGFNLVTAPLPGIIKLPMGTGIAAGAALYNHQIESQEKTFSAVYEAVTQGKKSEKIKMSSLTEMALEGAIDASFMSGFKGARKGIASMRTGSVVSEEINVQLMPPTVEGEKLTRSDLRVQLSQLAESSDPELSLLAKRLLREHGNEPVQLWQSNLEGDSFYNVKDHVIRLSANASEWEQMHEIIHSLTARKLRYGLDHPTTKLGETTAELEKLRTVAIAAYDEKNDKRILHYLSGIEEFVAGLYSGDRTFSELLSGITLNDTDERSFLARVWDAILALLSITKEHESALTKAVGLTNQVLTTPLAVKDEGKGTELLHWGKRSSLKPPAYSRGSPSALPGWKEVGSINNSNKPNEPPGEMVQLTISRLQEAPLIVDVLIPREQRKPYTWQLYVARFINGMDRSDQIKVGKVENGMVNPQGSSYLNKFYVSERSNITKIEWKFLTSVDKTDVDYKESLNRERQLLEELARLRVQLKNEESQLATMELASSTRTFSKINFFQHGRGYSAQQMDFKKRIIKQHKDAIKTKLNLIESEKDKRRRLKPYEYKMNLLSERNRVINKIRDYFLSKQIFRNQKPDRSKLPKTFCADSVPAEMVSEYNDVNRRIREAPSVSSQETTSNAVEDINAPPLELHGSTELTDIKNNIKELLDQWIIDIAKSKGLTITNQDLDRKILVSHPFGSQGHAGVGIANTKKESLSLRTILLGEADRGAFISVATAASTVIHGDKNDRIIKFLKIKICLLYTS